MNPQREYSDQRTSVTLDAIEESVLDSILDATARRRHDVAMIAVMEGRAVAHIGTGAKTGKGVTCCMCGDGSCRIGPFVTRSA